MRVQDEMLQFQVGPDEWADMPWQCDAKLGPMLSPHMGEQVFEVHIGLVDVARQKLGELAADGFGIQNVAKFATVTCFMDAISLLVHAAVLPSPLVPIHALELANHVAGMTGANIAAEKERERQAA